MGQRKTPCRGVLASERCHITRLTSAVLPSRSMSNVGSAMDIFCIRRAWGGLPREVVREKGGNTETDLILNVTGTTQRCTIFETGDSERAV